MEATLACFLAGNNYVDDCLSESKLKHTYPVFVVFSGALGVTFLS